MIRMMTAAAGLSFGLLMMPVATAPAKADININIGGIGNGKGISCNGGRRLVQDYGYWNVRTRNCAGRYYEYFGTRNYKSYIIKVDSYKARIVDRRRIYY